MFVASCPAVSHDNKWGHVDCEAPVFSLHLEQSNPPHAETKQVFREYITLTGQKNIYFGWIGIDWGRGKKVFKVPVDQYAMLDHCFQ